VSKQLRILSAVRLNHLYSILGQGIILPTELVGKLDFMSMMKCELRYCFSRLEGVGRNFALLAAPANYNDNSMRIARLMRRLGPTFRANYLHLAMKQGLIEVTRPEKPPAASRSTA